MTSINHKEFAVFFTNEGIGHKHFALPTHFNARFSFLFDHVDSNLIPIGIKVSNIPKTPKKMIKVKLTVCNEDTSKLCIKALKDIAMWEILTEKELEELNSLVEEFHYIEDALNGWFDRKEKKG